MSETSGEMTTVVPFKYNAGSCRNVLTFHLTARDKKPEEEGNLIADAFA